MYLVYIYYSFLFTYRHTIRCFQAMRFFSLGLLGATFFLFLHYTKICNTHDYYMLHIFMTITYFRVHTTLHSLPHLSTLTATPLCTETATPLSVRSLPRLTIISHDYFIFSCNALLFFQTPCHCCCDIILR